MPTCYCTLAGTVACTHCPSNTFDAFNKSTLKDFDPTTTEITETYDEYGNLKKIVIKKLRSSDT
jgi:hypothetical protein